MLLRLFVSIALIAFTGILFGQVSATYNEVTNKTKKGLIDTYITESGEAFAVGDTITLGTAFRNEQFDHIQQNAGMSFFPLDNTASNSKVVIKKMKAGNRLMYVYTTKPQGYVYPLVIVNFESAVLNGEVKSKVMSSDEALEELKKWKSKLDLELITQEEFDAKKKELSGFIK